MSPAETEAESESIKRFSFSSRRRLMARSLPQVCDRKVSRSAIGRSINSASKRSSDSDEFTKAGGSAMKIDDGFRGSRQYVYGITGSKSHDIRDVPDSRALEVKEVNRFYSARRVLLAF